MFYIIFIYVDRKATEISMLLFYIRHGDPIYNPNSLTPLGERQAEAVAKRLARYGIDKIYSSTSTRAIQTAQPTCEILKKEMELIDFCNETHAWNDLTITKDGITTWLFHNQEICSFFNDAEIKNLGFNWYAHPDFTQYKKGIDRVYNETDNFIKTLGYEHIRYSGKYKVTEPNNQRIALFAHQGFGLSFLSCLLDIPYPMFATHFDMSHTGMTVIEFTNENGISIPKVLTLSSDSHLYKDDLPTKYNNELYF